MRNSALFDFAYHGPEWLETVDFNTKDEPWGKNRKILEIYLRSNFEIAKQQRKIYQDNKKGFAIWRAGYLVTPTMDPVWLYYEKNEEKYRQKWQFAGVKIGDCPVDGVSVNDYTVVYNPPEFHPDWNIYIDPRGFEHILVKNHDRLVSVFGEEANNPHRLFRTIYGEIMLEQKEAAGVIPQWYMGGYNFLMPLCLTQPNKVDLTAALTIDETMKRYQLRTLLLPHYAYANARAIAKSRTQFASWAIMEHTELDTATIDENDSDE
jgi:hypothetical protein